MKKATISHIKFVMLGSLLELSRWETVGILETLWQFCQNNAYDGDLSRFEPKMIAVWFGWKGDPLLLIDALVESGWIDRNCEGLLVHDWNDHAPNWVKGALKTTLSKQVERSLSGTLSNPLSGTLEGKVRKGKVKKETSTKRGSNVSASSVDGFTEWYQLYPKKVAPKAAEKAYAKAIAEIAKSEDVDSSQAALLLLQWTQERLTAIVGTEERYRPHPASWLNAGRYRDVLACSASGQPIERTKPETKVGGYVNKGKKVRA